MPEVEHAARYLATHALLLLGLGVLAASVAIAAIVGAARLAARLRPAAERSIAGVARRAARIASVGRLIRRVPALVPSAYLALHLALGFVAAVAIAAFAMLAEQVVSAGELAAFDLAFARALYGSRSPQWERVFAAVSLFGTGPALAFLTVLVGLWLYSRRQTGLAIAWAAAQAGGGLLNRALKELFQRTRPEFADPSLAASWSFPSGHAMGTFIFCGVLCYLVLRGTRSWAAAAMVPAAAATWCVVMAFSRLYLGVHFASDVVAGVVAGTAWVAACVSALELLRRRTAAPRRA